MQDVIVDDIKTIIDEYFYVADLNELMMACVLEKAVENSIWSEITIYSHYMFGGASPVIQRIAAHVEIILLALDMIDDLQDRDNPDKLWMKTPQEYMLNAIIAFLMASVSDLSKIAGQDMQDGATAFPLISEISRMITRSINGQHVDLNNTIATEADYINMVLDKSGSLIRLALYTGYATAGCCSLDTLDRINELANDVGMIAQLENDLRDLLRFDLKNDLLLKKRTLPILYLLAAEDNDFPYIKQYYDGELSRDELLKLKHECIQYFRDSGCIEYTKIIQNLYTNHAEEMIDSLDTQSPWKEKFKEVVIGVKSQFVS